DKNVTEVWYEISEINMLKNLDKYALRDFLNKFEFIEVKRGNYINYIAINKVLFVFECIKFLETDLKNLSNLLDFQGFEALVKEILIANNYRVINNFRFSDKSYFKRQTSQTRYEIDVIGLFRKMILLIDAKQWNRRDSYSSINKAAKLQYQRVLALKNNPEVFSRLIHELVGINPNLRKFLPFNLIPMMVTLEENGNKLNDIQIPLVSVSNLNAFIQELDRYFHLFKTVEIKTLNIQKNLFSY
ncbi:MAG: hypothetical protein ACFFAO_17995, partial [Candidatus Hermodarchaeota archaeon]